MPDRRNQPPFSRRDRDRDADRSARERPLAYERRSSHPPRDRAAAPEESRGSQHGLQRIDDENLIWGRNAVLESLRGWRKPVRLFIGDGVRSGNIVGEILQLAGQQEIPVERVPNRELDERMGDLNHQGIVAEVPPFQYAELDDALALAASRGEMPLLLLLDSIQDPQNLGTLLRTAEAVGVHGIVLPRHRAAGITGAVVKSSAGAVEHVPVIQVANLSRTIEDLKEAGVWIAGLDMEAKGAYDGLDLNMPLAIVIGSEGKGISRIVQEHCDLLLHLPMQGKIGSLNAAVAGSIALYEAWRQRSRGHSRRGEPKSGGQN